MQIEFKLLLIILLYRIVDWITTIYSLSIGFVELNPFMRDVKAMIFFEALMLSSISTISMIVGKGNIGNIRIPKWIRIL